MRKLAVAAPALALVLALVLALPAVAGAATVGVDANGVAFSDAAGQDNRVDVDTGDTVGCPAAWCVEIEDDAGAPTSTDPRCAMNGLDTLTCGFTAPLPVVVDLGAGQDLLASFIEPGDTLTGRGGPGNDELYGTSGATTLDGGDGDDALYPDDNPYSLSSVTPGPDIVTGGSGTDTVWYIDHAAGVRVSLDGIANDGGPSDVDNVHPDVERIIGSRFADVLSGSDADNVIEAREGGDQLLGGAGDDQLSGESEHDVIDGGPGADTLTGGSGDDRLTGGPGVDSFNGDSADLLYTGNDTLEAADGVADPWPAARAPTWPPSTRTTRGERGPERLRDGPSREPRGERLRHPRSPGAARQHRPGAGRVPPHRCDRSTAGSRCGAPARCACAGAARCSSPAAPRSRSTPARSGRSVCGCATRARALVRRRGRLAVLAVATSSTPAGPAREDASRSAARS